MSPLTQDDRANAVCSRYAPHGVEPDGLGKAANGDVIVYFPTAELTLRPDGTVSIVMAAACLLAEVDARNGFAVTALATFTDADWAILVEALAAIGIDTDIRPEVLKTEPSGRRTYAAPAEED